MSTSPLPPLVIDVVDALGTVLITVTGELDLQTVPQLAAVMTPLRARQCELDLVQVPFADSAALNFLVRHRRDALAEAGSLRVVAVSSQVRRLLKVAGVEGLLLADPDAGQSGSTPF
ncbi:STAS domain-containing protein [Streptomyces sp. Act143]|uniref:STAS domain-containing protein n=1 Tax=Streptomyces sp. Act143 TaxID=2200760 RepID=UPI0015E80A57|nr:STAS domain-containing protein [Streptomyces sp. Act143]